MGRAGGSEVDGVRADKQQLPGTGGVPLSVAPAVPWQDCCPLLWGPRSSVGAGWLERSPHMDVVAGRKPCKGGLTQQLQGSSVPCTKPF